MSTNTDGLSAHCGTAYTHQCLKINMQKSEQGKTTLKQMCKSITGEKKSNYCIFLKYFMHNGY